MQDISPQLPLPSPLPDVCHTTLSTRQVLQDLVLSHLDYCSVVWSGSTKKASGKLQLSQNRAAWLALGCTQRANINNMHISLSCLKVEERLTSSLLLFMRGIDMLNAPSCLIELLAHSSDIHAYPTRHATRGLFAVLKSRIDYGRRTVLHRAMNTWKGGDCEATQTWAQTHAYIHTITYALYTHVHMDSVL